MLKPALSALKAGQSATVQSVVATAGSKQLADMGFFAGAKVMMIRPGAPCIVRVGRSRVAIGESYQNMIGVIADAGQCRSTPVP